MKKQVIVIGLGRFGTSVARTLFGIGHDVLALDIDEKKVQSAVNYLTNAVQADATDEEALRGLGIANFDTAIVAMGSAVQSSVMATLLLKKLRVPYVISRAQNELHGSILEKIGADRVIYPEQEMGARLAHGLTLANVLRYIELTANYGVSKVTTPEFFVGKTLSDLGLGRGGKWGIGVLLIQREKEIISTPSSSEIVRKGDVMILAGQDDQLEQLLMEQQR